MNIYHEFLRTRRSMRHFRPEPVSDAVLERVLESACYAPSAHNRQPWRFVLVNSLPAKQRLVQAMQTEYEKDLTLDGMPPAEITLRLARSRDRILQAPVVIVLCYHPGDMDTYPDPVRQQHEDEMGMQSTALAGGTLLLAAHAEGLGSVWMCAPLFSSRAVKSALAIPPDWQPQALLLLGYPSRQPAEASRNPLAAVVYRVDA